MASRSTSPGPSESIFSGADESFTPAGSEFGTDGYEGSVGRSGLLPLAAAAGPVDLSQLNLVSLNRPWNEPGEVNRQAFHAISTVLSHPTRRPAPLRASRVPLPPAPPPDAIPRTNRKDLDAYVQQIQPIWEQYKQAMEGVQPAVDVESAREERRTSTSAVATPSLRSIPDVFFDEDFNLGNPHTFELVTSSVAAAAAPHRHSLASPNASFASLPPVLEPLDENEVSASPTTGDDAGVIGSSTATQPVDLEDPSSSRQLHARLSTHLELVEQHLVLEISQRSASFFTALTNLQDLQTESETCLARIESLQQELRALDSGQAQRGLEALALVRELRSLKAVDGAVKELRSIDEAVAMVRTLVANDDVYGALDLWEEVDGWLKRKGKAKETDDLSISADRRRKGSNASRFRSSSLLGEVAESGEEDEDDGAAAGTGATSATLRPAPLPRQGSSSTTSTLTLGQSPRRWHKTPTDVDLTTSSALSNLPQTLAALSLSIATQFEAELTGFLSAELGVRKPASDFSLEERLKPLLTGLIRTRESSRIVGVFREIALSSVREAARRYVAPENPEHADANAAALAKRLKGLSHTAFLTMETSMFQALLTCLRSVNTTTEAIDKVLTQIQSNGPASGFTYTTSLNQELHDVLASAAELAHSRASKIIGVRNDQHASLPLENFIRVFNAAWTFVVDCEVLCQKMIVGLRGTMVVQAKTFLQTYHSQRLSSSARLVENEVWSPEEPSAAQQRAVDLIIEAAMADPAELVVAKDDAPSAPSIRPETASDLKNGTLRIEDRAFFVVPATSASTELLLDYLRLIINIELITTDVMSKVIEYLKSFNSRTCQVVLGAGAMRSAGLKNITAKHLALASQSLSVMVTLIPYVREAARRHLSAKQAVMLVEFDKLKRDYQEHQNEIHAKLIAIMGDRLAIHIASFREIDWEATPSKAGKPNDYVELLIKETSQLHKILSKYLPETTVEHVISQVFAAINNGLSDAYAAVELKSDAAKSRLALDALHLVKKLSALPNVTPIAGTLPALVKDKPVPRKPVGQSMKRLMRRVSSQGKVGEGFEDSESVVDDNDAAGGAEAEDTLAASTQGEHLAVPGASSLGTPLSSVNPSEAATPINEPADPAAEQALDTALPALPKRSSSLAPSPLAPGQSAPLPPLPPSPAGGVPSSDPLLNPNEGGEGEAPPAPIERDGLQQAIVEPALPPLPDIEETSTADDLPTGGSDDVPSVDVSDETPVTLADTDEAPVDHPDSSATAEAEAPTASDSPASDATVTEAAPVALDEPAATSAAVQPDDAQSEPAAGEEGHAEALPADTTVDRGKDKLVAEVTEEPADDDAGGSEESVESKDKELDVDNKETMAQAEDKNEIS